MLILFDAMIFLYGAYAIYSSVRMKQTGQLNTLFTGMATGQVRNGGNGGCVWGSWLFQRLCEACPVSDAGPYPAVPNGVCLVLHILKPRETQILVDFMKISYF